MLWNNHLAQFSPQYLNLIMIEDLDAMDEPFFLEFKELILREKQRFIRGFSAHLLSYGLGRELGVADGPTLDEITIKAMAGQDQIRAILKNIAMSEPFLHKNTLAIASKKKSPGQK